MRTSTHKRAGGSHSPSRTSSSLSPWRRRSRSRSWSPRSSDRGSVPDRIAESSTIVLRGLALGTSEANVERALAAFTPRHVRVMPCDDHRPAYCFVDFGSPGDARAFMEAFPGSSGGSGLHLALGGAELQLEYGRRRLPPGQGHSDWQCDSCNAVNFARRARCYQCCCERPLRPRLVSTDTANALLTPAPVRPEQEGRYDCSDPTATLVLYRLSKYSGEAEVTEVMRSYVTPAPPGLLLPSRLLA